jgi:hypothetical protein
VRFWLYEIEVKNMPRFWLRWDFEILQSLRRLTDGPPCDAQLGMYLMDCDLFVSADRTLTQVLEKCRSCSLVRIASAFLVPGGAEAVRSLFDILAEVGSGHGSAKARTKSLPAPVHVA